jgi:hypothetical protein
MASADMHRGSDAGPARKRGSADRRTHRRCAIPAPGFDSRSRPHSSRRKSPGSHHSRAAPRRPQAPSAAGRLDPGDPSLDLEAAGASCRSLANAWRPTLLTSSITNSLPVGLSNQNVRGTTAEGFDRSQPWWLPISASRSGDGSKAWTTGRASSSIANNSRRSKRLISWSSITRTSRERDERNRLRASKSAVYASR